MISHHCFVIANFLVNTLKPGARRTKTLRVGRKKKKSASLPKITNPAPPHPPKKSPAATSSPHAVLSLPPVLVQKNAVFHPKTLRLPLSPNAVLFFSLRYLGSSKPFSVQRGTEESWHPWSGEEMWQRGSGARFFFFSAKAPVAPLRHGVASLVQCQSHRRPLAKGNEAKISRLGGGQ